jgi:hypothetical protein
MRNRSSLIAAIVLLSASPAPAQYGPGGYGGGAGGGGFGGGVGSGGYGGGYQRPDSNVDPYRSVPSHDPFQQQRGMPQGPQYVEVVEYFCESCNQKVSSSARPGQRCPHCGVLWNAGPGSSNSASSSSGMRWSGSSSRAMGKLIGAAIAGLIALCGVIWRAAAGSSSSSTGAVSPHKPLAPPDFSGFSGSPTPPSAAPGENIAELKRRLRPGNGDRGIS